MRAPKVGDLVAVEFLDHMTGGGVVDIDEFSDLVVSAYGKVVSVTPSHIIIDAWHPTDPDTHRNREDYESFCIIRKCIKQLWRLKREV